MKKVLAFLASGMIMAAVMLPSLSLAALPGNPEAELTKVGTGAGFTSTTDLPVVIGRVINVAFSLLGIVAVVIIVWSGWQWMMSGGVAADVQKAKDRIIAAVIGIAIMLLAYSITNFILSKLTTVTA
jgi:hypothetical protein